MTNRRIKPRLITSPRMWLITKPLPSVVVRSLFTSPNFTTLNAENTQRKKGTHLQVPNRRLVHVVKRTVVRRARRACRINSGIVSRPTRKAARRQA